MAGFSTEGVMPNLKTSYVTIQYKVGLPKSTVGDNLKTSYVTIQYFC